MAPSASRRIRDAKSLGIVLFQNTSADRSDEYLGRALTEQITERLRATGAVRVVATRKFGYEQAVAPDGATTIGRSLGVGHVLVARVGRAEGGGVRVEARVVRTRDGTVEWRTGATALPRDLPALEAELTSGIVHASTGREISDARLAGWSDPPNGQTVEHYLRGNFYSSLNTTEGYELALSQYDSATALDPAFAAGFARSALTIASILEWGWWNYSPEFIGGMTHQGLVASGRALRLDSTSVDAWVARGALLGFRNPKSYAGARAAFRRALVIDPRNPRAHRWYGRALMQLGERGAARREFASALALAPRDGGVLYDLAQLDRHEGRFSSSCILLDSAIASDPTAAQAYILRALIRVRRGELRFAWADAETGTRLGWPLWGKAVSAVIDAEARDTSSALARTKALIKSAPSWGSGAKQWTGEYLAIALAASGDVDSALDLLEHVQPRGARLWFALTAPEFAPLRRNSRFRALLVTSRPGH